MEIILNMGEIILEAGQEETLSGVILPEEEGYRELTWDSDNPGVARVDPGGTVTGVSPGTATITALAGEGGEGARAECLVTVKEAVTVGGPTGEALEGMGEGLPGPGGVEEIESMVAPAPGDTGVAAETGEETGPGEGGWEGPGEETAAGVEEKEEEITIKGGEKNMKVAEMPDNTLRIGKDFYLLDVTESLTFENVMDSITTGEELYFKFGGRWYDIMPVQGFEDLMDLEKAFPPYQVSMWNGLRYAYLEGDRRVEVDMSPSATWSALPSFPGSTLSDFRVEVTRMDSALYFEVYAAGYKVGKRTPIHQHLRHVGITFSNPAGLKVKFFSHETATNPVYTADCREGGLMEVTEIGQPTGTWSVIPSFSGAITSDFFANLSGVQGADYYEICAAGNRVGRRVPIDKHVRSTGIVFSNLPELKVKFYSDPEGQDPVALATCNADGSLNIKVSQEEEDKTEDKGGAWSAEPSFPGAVTSDFRISLKDIAEVSYFEVYAAGTLIGNRVPLEGYVRSTGIVFSDNSVLEVWLYKSANAVEPVEKASCGENGQLLFQE